MRNTNQTHENICAIKRVLLVAADPVSSGVLARQLQENHCLVTQAHSYDRALELIKGDNYDLVLLDEPLQNMDGEAFCTSIRALCVCPIIFISNCDNSDCVIAALQNGGDDYMLKPVDCEELLARAEAIDRRLRKEEKETDHLRTFRSFTIDLVRRNVVRNERIIELAPTEYALLLCLTERPDTLLLYQELYERVWNLDSLGDTRTIAVHISHLRKKLDPEHTGLISTVRGVGYIFSDR